MQNTHTHCTHESFWNSHPPVPVQVHNGALLITVMFCENCGHLEYRSPPLSKQDEEALDKRMQEFSKKKEIMEPLKINR